MHIIAGTLTDYAAQPAKRSAVAWVTVLWAFPLAAIVALLLLTPTLNLDDLSYALNAREVVHHYGFWKGILVVLSNSDLGAIELRTYGLARAIQILTALVAGKSVVAIYSFLAVMHACGSYLVFRIARDLVGDATTAAFAGIAWFASPAVLPFLKVEHHYLYLIASYYPLLAWIWLAGTGRISTALGITLLTATWLLGEGPVIPMAAAVLAVAWIRRDARLVIQGAVAAALLASYVAYQLFLVRDPAYPQRFHNTTITDDGIQALTRFGKQLWEAGRGILGLSFYDTELAHRILGTGVFNGPWTVGLAAILIALIATLWFLGRNTSPRGRQIADHRPALVVLAVAVLSLAIYALLAVSQNGTFAIRYAATFYTLAPLGIIFGISAVLPARIVRTTAGVVAAASVALSVGLLYRAEILINRPNREILAQLRPGTAIVLDHAGWPRAENGGVDNGYPGLVSIYRSGFPNPFRSAWTTELALSLYSGVTVATSCQRLPSGRMAVSYNAKGETVFKANDVKVVGLPDVTALEPLTLRATDVCPLRPSRERRPEDSG